MPVSQVFNIDCVEYMRTMPDNSFELAVVDPPYGIGQNWRKDKGSRFYRHESSYRNESIPGADYFAELFRVSKNQIIWGANYYTEFLPARNSWIVWDKQIDYPTQHMSEGELAWTSFNIPLRIVSLIWNGCCRCEKRSGIHPHEKPKRLYRWIYENYLRGGGRYSRYSPRFRLEPDRGLSDGLRFCRMRDRPDVFRCPAGAIRAGVPSSVRKRVRAGGQRATSIRFTMSTDNSPPRPPPVRNLTNQ